MTLRFFWHLLSPKWPTTLWLMSTDRVISIFCQFGLKRRQKMGEVLNYKILQGFSWKLQYLSVNYGFKNAVSAMLWSELDSFFWEAVYCIAWCAFDDVNSIPGSEGRRRDNTNLWRLFGILQKDFNNVQFCHFLQDVACYNPYAYSARFLPNTMSANAYSAMGDIDWSKRR